MLWRLGSATVRQVHDVLSQRRPSGYTTTLKLMQIMSDKGLVARDQSQRAHIYRARLGEEETQSRLLGDLLDRAFSGSASRLVMQALSSHRTSAEELSEIRALLNELEGDPS